MADSNRAMQCRRLLSNLSEESKQAKLKLVQCEEKRTSLTQEISLIESRLAALQEEFQRKQLLVANAKKEYQDCSVRIEYNEAKKIGLCIRFVIVAKNHIFA
jgi:chromosome segregation ATPase